MNSSKEFHPNKTNKSGGMQETGGSICNVGVSTSNDFNQTKKGNTGGGGIHKMGVSKSNADLRVNESKYLSKSQSQTGIQPLSKQRSNLDYGVQNMPNDSKENTANKFNQSSGCYVKSVNENQTEYNNEEKKFIDVSDLNIVYGKSAHRLLYSCGFHRS